MVAATEKYADIYPVEIAQILKAGEIIFDRSARGKSYFYIILDTQEEQ